MSHECVGHMMKLARLVCAIFRHDAIVSHVADACFIIQAAEMSHKVGHVRHDLKAADGYCVMRR